MQYHKPGWRWRAILHAPGPGGEIQVAAGFDPGHVETRHKLSLQQHGWRRPRGEADAPPRDFSIQGLGRCQCEEWEMGNGIMSSTILGFDPTTRSPNLGISRCTAASEALDKASPRPGQAKMWNDIRHGNVSLSSLLDKSQTSRFQFHRLSASERFRITHLCFEVATWPAWHMHPRPSKQWKGVRRLQAQQRERAN